MEVITIESAAFERIEKKLDEIQSGIDQRNNQPKDTWLDNQEFMQLLKISKRTAQHYRDAGLISFSQVGNKIYYKLSDVQAMLEKHYRKAFKTRP